MPGNKGKAAQYGLPAIDTGVLRAVLDVWHALGREGDLPRVDDLDAVHFLRFSTNLIIADVMPDGDVAFRIVGESVATVFGRSLKGLRLSQMHNDPLRPESIEQFSEVLQQRKPLYYDGPAIAFQKDYIRARRLLLPFVGESGAVEKLIIALVYGD